MTDDSKIQFEEPPVSRRRGRSPIINWDEYIEILKEHPGKSARLNIPEELGTPSRYSQWAHGIRNNTIKAFRDSGLKWDATSSKDGLWVRMIPESHH